MSAVMELDWAGMGKPERQANRTGSGDKGSGEDFVPRQGGLPSRAELEVNERRMG